MDQSSKGSEETLHGRILRELKSSDKTRQLAAIREVTRLERSSDPILAALEECALHGSTQVKRAALEALDSRASQQVRASSLKHLKRAERDAILGELEDWQNRGLITPEGTEVLTRRYDWTRPAVAPPAPAAVAPKAPAAPAAAAAVPKRVAQPAAPRPSLSDRLLSQTATNIALYLGAFLVIGAAIILGALVEVTRLPILLGFTVLFGLGATALRRRLPQPSFILFTVFSVLLPISANVIAQTAKLRGLGLDAYWSAIFLLMAAIWAFGTRLYTSRLFSLAALVAWSLAFIRFPRLFDAPAGWEHASLMPGLVGTLAAVPVLRRWKDDKFASPFYLTAQVGTVLTLLSGASLFLIRLLEDPAASTWIAAALFSLAAAAFYIVSSLFFRFALFPWLAVACFAPLSMLVLGALDADATGQAVGLAAWGLLFLGASEVLWRAPAERLRRYHWPSLALSPVVLATAAAIAFAVFGFDDKPLAYGFGIALAAALGSAILHILRPRAYVWLFALLFGLAAYFAFFSLPFMESVEIYGGHIVLGAAALLLIPELLFRQRFTSKDAWRWPAFWLGVVLAVIAWLVFVLDRGATVAQASIGMGVLALLMAGHALHLRQPWIAYLAAGTAALTLDYAYVGSSLDFRLILLTGLAAVYYASGLLLRAEPRRAWSTVLRVSGLILGTIVVGHYFAHPALWGTLRIHFGGVCTLAVGAMVLVETYLRRDKRLEAAAPFYFSLAAFLLLRRLGQTQVAWHLFALSLIWLVADLLYARTIALRPFRVGTRAIGVALALAAGVTLIGEAQGGLHADQSAWAFAVYAVLFAASAWLYRQPRISIAASAGVALALIFALQHARLDWWLPVLTALAALHYASGFRLQRPEAAGWGSALRLSGLALGALVATAGVLGEKSLAAWYALIAAALFFVETYRARGSAAEVGGPALLSLSAFAARSPLAFDDLVYAALASSLAWLGADLVYHQTLTRRPLRLVTQIVGAGGAGFLSLWLLTAAASRLAAICFVVYAVFLAAYAWFRRRPSLGYTAAASLALAAFFETRVLQWDDHLLTIGLLAAVLYAAGYLLRRRAALPGWDEVLIRSGLVLGTLNAVSAVLYIGVAASIPVALTGTLFAVEAFARRRVWLALPANALYLWSYFLILLDLKVDQPQFFSVGAALLGMLMHYLLNRSRNHKSAFFAGMVSQLVLLSTTLIQLVSTSQLVYFVVLFFQGLAVLAYGIVIRSRSLLITPILFIVASVLLVIYSTLKGLTTVVLIGCSGIILLLLGILAVVLRERIARLGERMGDWQA